MKINFRNWLHLRSKVSSVSTSSDERKQRRLSERVLGYFGFKPSSLSGVSSKATTVDLSSEKRKALRKARFKQGLTKVAITGGVAVLVGGLALQAGVSVMGTQTDYKVASAENEQGTKSTALERSINQIKIAYGESNGSLTKGKEGLSPSEVKTLGFYITNYYSPFTTRVTDKNGVVGKFKEDIQGVLENNAGLATDGAGEIAGLIAKLTDLTATKVYLAKSDDGGQTWKGLNRSASYYEVLFGSVGLFTDEMLTKQDDGDYKFSLKSRYEYDANKGTLMGLVREDLKNKKDIERSSVVYEWNPSPSGQKTVSQVVFYQNFTAIDQSVSFGANFITLDSTDPKIKEALSSNKDFARALSMVFQNKPISDLDRGEVNTGTLKGFYDHSIYSASMFVDGFGSLLANTGAGKDSVGKFVVMPGSQNPMMYARKAKASDTSSSESDSSSSGTEKKEDTKDTKKASVTEKLKTIYHDANSGVGRSLPLNNLNSIALSRGKGGWSIEGDNATLSASTDTTVSAFVGVGKTSKDTQIDQNFDQTKGSLFKGTWTGLNDAGSALNEMLYSQWLMRRIPNNKAFAERDGKVHFHVDTFDKLSKGDSNVNYKGISSGKQDLYFPAFATANNVYRAIGGSTTIQGVEHIVRVTGAKAFADKFGSRAGSDDGYHFQQSMSVTAPIIDDIVTFDSFGFADKEVFKPMGDNGTLLVGKARDIPFDSNRLTGDGKWKGVGSAGTLADSSAYASDTSDKKYGANVYASTVLVRGNPLNPNFGYVVNLENSGVIDEDDLNGDGDGSDGKDMDVVLKNMAYYMLNPTMGREYKQRWSKTFMNQALLSSLEDMIGANTASSYSGTTRYLELTGFATIPRLNEIRFTDYLYTQFSTWGVTILIMASILMLIFVFVGQVRILPAVVGVVAFGFMLYSPPKMINSAINVTNQISSYFFKDKFMFWVMATHQNYEDSVSQLAEEAKAGNYDNYTALLVRLQGGWGGEENEGETDVFEWQQTLGATIKVRWMAPKKDGYINQVRRDLNQTLEEGSSDGSSDGDKKDNKDGENKDSADKKDSKD